MAHRQHEWFVTAVMILSLLLWLQTCVIMETVNFTVSHSNLFPHCAENNFKSKWNQQLSITCLIAHTHVRSVPEVSSCSLQFHSPLWRKRTKHRQMSDVDLSSTIMMTHQKSFFLTTNFKFALRHHNHTHRVSGKSRESTETTFLFHLKINVVVCLCCLPDTYCSMPTNEA